MFANWTLLNVKQNIIGIISTKMPSQDMELY